MGINTDINYTSPNEALTPVLIPENLPSLDVTQESSIAQSEASSQIIDYIASSPILTDSGSNLYSQVYDAFSASTLAKYGTALMDSYNETMNYILDQWSQSIQQQSDLARANTIRDTIKRNRINANLLEHQREQININHREIEQQELKDSKKPQGVDFVTFWRNASPEQKKIFNDTFGQEAINKYYSNLPNPVEQNFEAIKLPPILTPLFTKEAFEINPMTADITLRNIGTEPAASIPSLLISTLPETLQIIPQVNLMLPLILVSLTAEAALNVFAKNKNSPQKDNNAIDEQFIQALAKKTLRRTQDLSDSMTYKHPNYALLDHSQKQNFDLGAGLLALTTVLVLDVKTQAQFSNLSPEEFASLLKKGIPGNDLLNQVVQQIHVLLSKIPDRNQAAEYVNFLLNYIDKASSSSIASLKNLSHVLLYATQEIGPEIRAVNSPE